MTSLEPERRQLTVMFADLVGSTALSERLDPEELRQIILAYHEACAALVRRYDGHIAQYLGDGLLVYFGHPSAHEDDAQRSLRAGLGIIAGMRLLNERIDQGIQVRLAVRIGIHTGLVVLGEVGAEDWHENLALGSTPNIAARLQGLAEPDTVVVSEATRSLAGRSFRFHDLGAQQLKGLTEPMRVWRVDGYASVSSRFDAATGDMLTPLVGREQEIGLLLNRCQLVQEGFGQTALVAGEAGIGKSRLLHAFESGLPGKAWTKLRFHCSPYYTNSPFYPISVALQQTLRFGGDEPAEAKLDKLEDLLVRRYRRPISDVKLIAPLLSVEAERRHGRLVMTPRRQKEETVRAMIELAEATARERPTIALFEDAHWADPSTVELLDELVPLLAQLPLFLIITCRPEFNARLCAHSHVIRIALTRLTRVQSAEVVRSLAPRIILAPALIEEIVEKTDGVPLFIEETTKSVLESSAPRARTGDELYVTRSASQTIPSTLRDSLMARLDRVPAGKVIAQTAATIGRQFTRETLAAITALPSREVTRGLSTLIEAGLVLVRQTSDGKVYSFKHALVQDVASASLLRSTRETLHAKLARLIERRHPKDLEAYAEPLARHYTAAAQYDKAIFYWRLAGQRAAARSANVEATRHIETGMGLLPHLPEPARSRHELGLCTALGAVIIATKGYAASEVQHTYSRAEQLCGYVGDADERFAVLRGQCQLALMQGQYEAAAGRARRLLEFAQAEGHSAYLLDADLVFGLIRIYQGRFRLADRHLHRATLAFDPDQHRSHSLRQGIDIGSACRAYRARVLWFLGYPDRALALADEAARMAMHPSSVALGVAQAVGMLALVRQARRDITRDLADHVISYASEQRIAFWRALGEMLRGWLQAHSGEALEGLRRIDLGIDLCLSTGTRLGVSMFHLLRADASQAGALFDDGLAAIENALQHIAATGEHYFTAEVYRRRGELLLAKLGVRAHADAESCFLEALRMARRQGARAWALRTATSLARLWVGQGRGKDAYPLLSDAYTGFKEGFDTPDLREARSLLDELAPSAAGHATIVSPSSATSTTPVL